jgi:hypothetical protein
MVFLIHLLRSGKFSSPIDGPVRLDDFVITVVIVQFSHVSVYVKAILALGMIVVAVVPAIRFYTGLLFIGGATFQIRLDRKKLRGETSL